MICLTPAVGYDKWLPLAHAPGCFFEFLKILGFFTNNFLQIIFIFINMGPYGSENFKTILLPQIAAKSFETCPEFSSKWSSQKYIGDF